MTAAVIYLTVSAAADFAALYICFCEEAEGCLRFVREFPQSMSDLKPGGCNTEHSLCLKPQAISSAGEHFVCLRQPEDIVMMFFGIFYVVYHETHGGV